MKASSSDSMRGQWTGKYVGSRSGLITLNIDEHANGYTGYAHLMDDSGQVPVSLAVLRSTSKTNPVETTAVISQVRGDNHVFVTPEELAAAFPDMIFPKTGKATLKRTDRTLSVEWETDIGTRGTAELAGATMDDNSQYLPNPMGWADFKALVSTFPPRQYIYRGQDKPWKLQTAFHRNGRSDVFEFQANDIPALHRALSVRTRHIYNLLDADQNGAFWHLVQHHGYPTPMLDWSFSPFVAAFFAFRKVVLDDVKPTDNVRIFMFDHVAWHQHWQQMTTFRTHLLHLSVLEFIAIDNDRMIPQQSLSTITNVIDVEYYIRTREIEKNVTYLKVFDIPASERQQAMTDLSMMGITAGSMFPGFEGTCEELRERMFNMLIR